MSHEVEDRCAVCGRDLSNASAYWFGNRPHCLPGCRDRETDETRQRAMLVYRQKAKVRGAE